MLIKAQPRRQTTNSQIDTIFTKKNKIKTTREQQLKMLLLYGLIKRLNLPHMLQPGQTEQNVDQQNNERETCTAMIQLNQKIQSKIKQKRFSKRVNYKQKSKMEKQNSSNSKINQKFSITLPTGFKERQQHRQENNHFQKMSLLIDRKDKKCSLKQSVQNLIILSSSINKVKIIIYKHYKVIKERQEQHQINAIKYYCLTLFTHFKQLISLIQSNVDKNQNYKKYLRSLKKFEPSISKQNSNFQEHLQCLLFYFSSVIELKRFYQVCSHSDQFIIKIPSQDISNITHHIIRIRHYLGFIAKFISNPLMQNTNVSNKKIITSEVSKDIWKHIYQRKYTSKVSKNMYK